MLQVQGLPFHKGSDAWRVIHEGRILPKYVRDEIARLRRERNEYSEIRVLMTGEPGWISRAEQAARSARTYAEHEARALGWTEPSVAAEGAAAYAEALARQA
jgi:hypothetical protein